MTKLGALLTNPAMLSGVAGMMSQLAMQQAMDEIADYLAKIDAKVDEILRAQQDAVLVDVIGVDFVIDEAMTIRERVGRVSDVTWSKVQGTSLTIARTQAYALTQLRSIAEDLESTSRVGDLAERARAAEVKVQDWLAVLAKCSQLQDGIAVLELDRLLDSSPDDLDAHRLALRDARTNRLELIAGYTRALLDRMESAVDLADSEVVLHPLSASAVGRSSGQVAGEIIEFHEALNIPDDGADLQLRRWGQAVAELRDVAVEAVGDGVSSAVRVAGEGTEHVKAALDRAVGALKRLFGHPVGIMA